ncbi:efflux RND transporter permease subunit [Desulfobotulus mexicanus]|uniref:Efflux RND transporter permease subunit n=1 Tax=Desulfobotulus mexicanus TaxID=2586642 RepID=A0A5Q4VCP6_9BACT|nr:efflux RND transporter permease subunit [Desulfobotulus mexicanus]TYT75345.1 efflux RND transporter permease subunit [Desulfobotulus mexicanus]
MIVPRTAVKKRTTVMVLIFLLLIVGSYSYNTLPRESTPDISIPYVFVSTSYKGVAASDIETSITIPIEKKLRGMKGVKKVTSISSEGLSQVNIEFLPNTDINIALQDVRNKVDEAKGELPTDLEDDPAVFEVNFSEFPIVVFSLSGTSGIARLKEIADDLKDAIETIPGILEVEITGGLEREIVIEMDPDKLAYYRIPITAFQDAVARENINTSGGAITLGHGRYQIQVPGEFSTPEEILMLVVATQENRPIYLKDVARVLDDFKEETSRSRIDGRPSVNISVKKRSGENIIGITEEIDRLIEIEKRSWPEGTEIIKTMDAAKDIRSMVADLENNILSGLVLVVVILFFALGGRNALLVAMAVPFSMLITFSVLYALGITLNMVVLFSLTLALGMMVDNTIVIIENIYRFMEQGVPRFQAAIRASAEVAWPIIGATLTTLAAFMPLLFWPGVMGEFMKYLPQTLIITLSSSLFVALVINPALASFFMRVKGKKESPENGKLNGVSIPEGGEEPVRIEGTILNTYRGLMETALDNRIIMIITAFMVLVLLFFFWLLRVGLERPVEFFPSVDPGNIYVNFRMPEGADLEYIDHVIKRAEMAIARKKFSSEKNLEPITAESYASTLSPVTHTTRTGKTFSGPSDFDNIEHIYAKAVSGPSLSMFGGTSPNHIGIQFIDLEERKTPTPETMEAIRQRLQHIPGAYITVQEQDEGPPTGPPINIEITGDDFRMLGSLARQVEDLIRKVPHVRDVENDYIESIPSIEVRIDRQKAALFGLSTASIGSALKTAYNGMEVSTYREGDEDFDITVRLPEQDRKGSEVLKKLMISAPSGQLVPLSTLAEFSYSGTMGNIVRINHERVVTVKAEVDESRMPGATARLYAEKLMKEVPMPHGYSYRFTGEEEEQQESQEFLSKAFLAALLFIFLILVSLFNSVTQPLIIMTSVILSLGGVFLGLTVLNLPFGIIMSGVGVISLAGVVVNNAIVLIDYINRLKEKGYAIREAVIAGGATRLRPVLLTAITTSLGLIPMVTGISYDFRNLSLSLVSESSQWWRSMAIVVIFGLLVSTFLTLVVVPVLYSLIHSIQDKWKQVVEKYT